MEGVSAIHLGGWVERFKDPEAAARAIVTDRTEPHTLPAELFNLDSGTSLGITGFSVFDDPTPTGPGILLLTSTTTGEDKEKKTTNTVHFWLPAAVDATELRTDNMIQLKKTDSGFAYRSIRMGEENNF